MQSLGVVYVRPPTPGWNEFVPDHATVFVIGRLFVQTSCRPSLIDATHMDVMPALQSHRRCRFTPSPAYVGAIGTVTAQPYYLSAEFLAVPVTVSQNVWHGMRTFTVAYVPRLPLRSHSFTIVFSVV